MTNQPNTLVITEWLFPIIKEQLQLLHVDLKESIDNQHFELSDTVQSYHKLYGTFKVASLSNFATLTKVIEIVILSVEARDVPSLYLQKALYASEMLLHELTNYVQTGAYRNHLLLNRYMHLQQALSRYDIADYAEDVDSIGSLQDASSTENSISTELELVIESINTSSFNEEKVIRGLLRISDYIEVPDIDNKVTLSDRHRKTLIKAWRFATTSLLANGLSDNSGLDQLDIVTQYMLRDAASRQAALQECLWYVTAIWIESLGLNNEVPVVNYTQVLTNLDSLIHESGSDLDNSIISKIDETLVAIYIHSKDLVNKSENTKQLLQVVSEGVERDNAFFPRLLAQLELLIFQIDRPEKVINSLEDIKFQLLSRGWDRFEEQIDVILADLKQSTDSAEMLSQLQWQIERQMQELYGAIFAAYQAIESQIGSQQLTYHTIENTRQTEPSTITSDVDQNLSLTSQDGYSDDAAKTDDLQNEGGSDFNAISRQVMRQARISVEDIKGAFNEYLHQHDSNILKKHAEFEKLNSAFHEMGLHEVVNLVERSESVFAGIVRQQLTHITWELTDAVADLLVSLELFMDYLAQQTLDNKLLLRIEDQLLKSEQYLGALIEEPELLQQSLADLDDWTTKPNTDVTRYDDSGEIEALIDPDTSINVSNDLSVSYESDFDSSDFETDDNDTLDETHLTDTEAFESEELIAARAELKDDNFDMDEDIREIFIEEAEEVLETLETYLPQWQDDPQNLEPLGEIRRGFHTLKGSGRMVGANNAGEMAWAVENLLNRVLDKTLSVTDELISFIRETKGLIPTLVEDFSNQRLPSIDPAITVLKAHNLQKGRDINFGLTHDLSSLSTSANESIDEQFIDSEVTEVFADEDYVEEDVALNVNTSDNDRSSNSEVLNEFVNEVDIPVDATDADEDIKEIFIEEAQEVLETITPLYNQWKDKPEDFETLTDIRRGFHTLKGSGRMVGANSSAELAWAVENMLNRVLDNSIEATIGVRSLVGDVISVYPELVSTFEQGQTDYPEQMPLWIAMANAYSKKKGDLFDYNLVSSNTVTQSGSNAKSTESEVGEESGDSQESERMATITDNQEASLNAKQLDKTKEVNDLTDVALEDINCANAKLKQTAPSDLKLSDEATDFADIFIEEANELIESVEVFVKNYQDQEFIPVEDHIVRAFHTLRGAAGSPALTAISEVSAKVEVSLEKLQHQDEPMTASHLDAISQSACLIKKYLSDYTAILTPEQSAPDTLDHTANSDANLAALQTTLDEWLDEESSQEPLLNVSEIIDDDIDDFLEGEWSVESSLAQENLSAIELFCELMIVQSNELLKRVETSKKFTLVVSSLKAVYVKILSNPELAQIDEVIDALLAGHQQLTDLFDSLAGCMTLKVDTAVIADLNAIAKPENFEQLAAFLMESKVDDLNQEPQNQGSNNVNEESESQVKLDLEEIDTDPELLEIFLEEAQEIDNDIHASFSTWSQNPDDMEALKVLQRHLHTIKGGARMSGISSIGDLTHEAETVYEYFVGGRIQPSQQWVDVMQGVQDTLSAQVEYVVDHGKSFYAHKLVKQLHDLLSDKEVPENFKLELPVVNAPSYDEDVELNEAMEPSNQMIDAEMAETEIGFKRLQLNSWDGESPDKDILNVFLEEAHELVESSGENMQVFHANTGNIAVLQELQRELHTMKGGARMVNANGIANLAHEMENIYEDLASRRRPATRMISQLLTICHEWIEQAIYLLENGINPPNPDTLIVELQNFSRSPDDLHSLPKASLKDYVDAIDKYHEWRDAQIGRHDISEVPLSKYDSEQSNQTSQNNEMIRVSSGLMEQMINLSGESAINRARIDMSMTSINNTLDEMGTTVQRLFDQLRRMDLELEAQILSQIEEADMLEEGFDPLEMDQYSSLNQLSKSLSESASDLLDIKSTILDKTRDSEDLLLQLSRTQAELQNALMNSRMVPFSRLTPRLQRIVRQTANELNKSVNLEIVNSEDEMDRTILDHITSPLEHMLRNAVDHGVETPEEREEQGKPRTGRIVLDVYREGSEFVIKLSDDGKGINVEAVRKKAISQGLIDKDDTTLTDLDVMQYIFNAGLTTTNKVTQISGRGVGMDVVQSEIRQLGGTVSVESEAGKGSTFAIRVPLTVAISDALVVRVADAYYAIPLIQIERVERVNPEALYEYYQSDSNNFNLNGVDYRLRYLNEMLTGVSLNELAVNTNLSLPVIIVKNQTGQNLAIQVDEVAGARIEVVVKPLGRQLSHIAGLSAATIMGDGSVMLILDILALIRNAPARSILKKQSDKDKAAQKLRHQVLVVDDSVTVRKVTSRLLERQGYEVLVARDGVEALEILQDLKPDIMLLDIEMPRMDGFEVASHIRHDTRLKDLPIIMITSRTGDKHRERAMDIGVNKYMGKPFQEVELVETIQSVIGVTTGAQ